MSIKESEIKKETNPNKFNRNFPYLREKIYKTKNDNNTENFNNKNAGNWKKNEQILFIASILLFANDWIKAEKIIKSRSRKQIASHSQKFFINIQKFKIFDDIINNPFALKILFDNGNLKQKFFILDQAFKSKLKKFQKMMDKINNCDYFNSEKLFKDYMSNKKNVNMFKKLENIIINDSYNNVNEFINIVFSVCKYCDVNICKNEIIQPNLHNNQMYNENSNKVHKIFNYTKNFIDFCLKNNNNISIQSLNINNDKYKENSNFINNISNSVVNHNSPLEIKSTLIKQNIFNCNFKKHFNMKIKKDSSLKKDVKNYKTIKFFNTSSEMNDLEEENIVQGFIFNIDNINNNNINPKKRKSDLCSSNISINSTEYEKYKIQTKINHLNDTDDNFYNLFSIEIINHRDDWDPDETLTVLTENADEVI